jgi:hypothetical protein
VIVISAPASTSSRSAERLFLASKTPISIRSVQPIGQMNMAGLGTHAKLEWRAKQG